MNSMYLFFVILFPILAGCILLFLGKKSERYLHGWTLAVTVLTAAAAWMMILKGSEEPFILIHFTDQLQFTLQFDTLGRFFAGIIATLWPFTVIYGTEYMHGDQGQHVFFGFFTMAFGITLGVSMSGNLFTLYCFYEMLTLSTVPLVVHGESRDAVRAGRTYILMSIGGAAFVFVSMIFLIVHGTQTQGPVLTQLFYLLGFFGFGVKAAVFPLYIWLPRASVAPTPVTALLHAVAVVKSGVFAIVRLTFFCYGTDLLIGSYAQYIALGFAIFTVFFGAARAVKESHWKRRLAYSTVANLSYILFGVLLMTEEGLSAGLLHMAFHAEIKILAFFCAGAVLHMTGREYLQEMDGIGYKMPFTFGCFTVSALALTGIPPFSGFVSKWQLLAAAASAQTPIAYVGAATILLAALLTALYMFPVIRRAFFPDRLSDLASLEKDHVREAGPAMLVPMCILAAGILITGLCAGPILKVTQQIAANISMWK